MLASRRALVACLALSPLAARAQTQPAEQLLLDDAQRDWLRRNPVVRYAVSFDVRPYVFFDGDRPVGYVIDLLRKAATMTGLEFELVRVRDRDDALQRLDRGEISLIPMMRIDDKRKRRFALTEPFASFTLGIFTRTDSPYVESLAALTGRRVAVPSGMTDSVDFGDQAPVMLPFSSTLDGVKGLVDRRWDAIVAPVPVVQHWIRQVGLDEVWLQATLAQKVPFGIACSLAAAPLASILDAVLRKTHLPERRALLDAWTAGPKPWIDPRAVGTAAAAVSVAASTAAVGMTLWGRRRAARPGPTASVDREIADRSAAPR